MASVPLAIGLPKFQPQLALKGLTLATAVVGLAIVYAYIWLLQFSPLSLLHHSPQYPDVLRLAPRQSVVAVALNAPLADVERLQRYLAPLTARRSAHRQWKQWLSAGGDGPLAEFLTATQLDFERDIQPWLGEESLLAVTSVLPEQLNYFVALSTQDLERSNLVLNLVWQQQYLQQQSPQIEVYKGVQLLTVPVADRHWVVGALGERYTLFATGMDVAREAIDSWQVEELSLVSSPDYRSAVSSFSPPLLGVAYSDLPVDSRVTDFWGIAFADWGMAPGTSDWIGIGVDNGRLSSTSAIASAA